MALTAGCALLQLLHDHLLYDHLNITFVLIMAMRLHIVLMLFAGSIIFNLVKSDVTC